MPAITSFRDLKVWQEAMQLVEDVYAMTRAFPRDERFGLSIQMRRSAVSNPSNVAEGFRRWRGHAFVNHVSIALGSQAEIETQIQIAVRLKYVSDERAAPVVRRVDEVGRMLVGLLKRLNQNTERPATR